MLKIVTGDNFQFFVESKMYDKGEIIVEGDNEYIVLNDDGIAVEAKIFKTE